MADKDEFKFDDDDAFPETDLSGAFSEGEQSAPDALDAPEYPMTIKKSGGNRTKLLLALLLVLVAGGGAYYYFMMNEPAPPPPPPRKAVAVAPKPAPAPAPQPATTPGSPAAPAAGQAQVAVVPPPAPPAVASAPAPAAPSAVAVTPPPKPAASVPAPVPAPASAPPVAPAKPAVAAAPPPATKTVTAPAPPPAAVSPAPAPAPKPTPAPAPKTVEAKAAPAATAATGGPWMVEAGTYLNAAALKAAEKKIRGLGYEPRVSTTTKNVRLTRLRIGSYPEGEVKEALAYARGVAPDAFAIRSGDTFTLYAGTFANPQNIREMTERLGGEGVRVEEEPVEVKRTISLLRFGGFADQSAATDAATRARKAGIAADVVVPR